MSRSFYFCIFLSLLSLKLALACLDGECRMLAFPTYFFFADKRLENHTIRTEQVPDFGLCELLCYHEYNCVSINFENKVSPHGTFNCELNNSTHRGHDEELVDKEGYFYRGADSACDAAHCDNGGTCQSGFTDKNYRCLCLPGFSGENCEKDINECAAKKHNCSNDAVCHNTKGSYKCKCKPGYTGDGRNCTDINECKAGTHSCVTDDECINSNGSYRCTDPVALFPLNATYGTKEINNRVTQGVANGVDIAPGPNGKFDGSYEFFGTPNSYIEFSNTAGGPLDVRHSMTMLCWLYPGGQDGPLFDYRTGSAGIRGVHLGIYRRKLYVNYVLSQHNSGKSASSPHTLQANEWKFVGASYDHVSGEAKLWINGVVVQTKNIGKALDLATQSSIRMGSMTVYSGHYFKGRIAEMQVYNKSLTLGQIRTIQKRTPHEVGYTVVVETADDWGAGTDTQIKIRVRGIAGNTRERELSGDFEQGSTDIVHLQDNNIGYVVGMDIYHNNRLLDLLDDWKLYKVVIKITGAPDSIFIYNNWVSNGWTSLTLSCPEGHHVNQQNYCVRNAINCKDIKEQDDSRGDGIYWLDPDGGSHSNEFLAYCDMTSYNGGWTMCYTTDEYAQPRTEVTYSSQSPYGSDGYRTNCNNIPFTEIMFIDHQTGKKAFFKQQENLTITAAASYGETGDPHGLWDGVGASSNYEYQLLICDHSFYSGFFVSGYTDCFKRCNWWCGDTSSPYFRTASTNPSYKGVAFNTNGHSPHTVNNRLMSVGLR